MDPQTRNLMLLGVAVGALYWWCKTGNEPFTALISAPYDAPADSDGSTLAPVMGAPTMGAPTMAAPTMAAPMMGAATMGAAAVTPGGMVASTAAPVDAAAMAQAASSAWQTEAQAINPYASTTNFVDSRAMDGVDSISGWTRKGSTWDVRGAVPIKRDPSASFFGQSSRMPPPPANNNVFCS